MKISEMCETERPREKMLSRGPAALGNAELLAILIRTGIRNAGALDLAHRLLSVADGNLLKLKEMTLAQITSVPGIKSDKAVSVMAALELGRRFVAESSYSGTVPVTTPDAVYKMLIPHLKGLKKEECWILMLNSSQIPLKLERMTSGGSTSTVIDNKDILRSALECGAQCLILVHNHPSGNPMPGKADIRQTEALQVAAKSMDLVLVDHVIISDGAYYSFADDRMKRIP